MQTEAKDLEAVFDKIPDMAAKRAELTPHSVAFVDAETGREWTFREVNDAADRIASGLIDLGLARGERLAVLTLNRVEFFVTLFACQKTGIIMAPLNWRQPVVELSEVISSVGASAVVFDADNAEPAMELAARQQLKTIAFSASDGADGSLEAMLDQPASVFVDAVDATAPWYLLFTSGTTGLPKAVIQTARMGWASAINTCQAVDLTSTDSSVNFLPLFHTAGINLYTLPLFLFGGRSTVLPRFEPDQIFDLIHQGKVNQLFGVPAIYQAFSLHPRVDEIDWGSVRCACGGAPLPEPLIRFFAERGGLVANGYGMTETGPTAFLGDPAFAQTKIGTVGRPLMLTEARVDGVEDGAEGEGEVLMRGPAITPGYFGNSEATEATFTKDGWLRTGDVARRDSDGCYYIVDRIKDMYISGGENVYPAEVERVLNGHPDILEAAVIGVADDKWGEVGAAFLIARPDRQIGTAALTPWCRERLAAYKVPKSFRVMEDFPRTAAGKVRKPVLRKQTA